MSRALAVRLCEITASLTIDNLIKAQETLRAMDLGQLLLLFPIITKATHFYCKKNTLNLHSISLLLYLTSVKNWENVGNVRQWLFKMEVSKN